MRQRSGLQALLLALIFTPFTAVLASDDWRPQLADLQNDRQRGPRTPFEIHIPSEVPTQTLQRLVWELDNIDVTQFIDNSRAPLYLFEPVRALNYGPHQLRLLEHTTEGDIIDRGVWEVEVRKSKAFREASLSMTGNLNLVRRVSDSESEGLPDRNTASGSLTLDAQAAEGGWRGTARIPLLFDRSSPQHKGDLGDFLVTSAQGPVLVQAGHHAIPGDSLVLGGFYNRGVSATLATVDRRHAITGFTMHGSPISGTREGLGISDSNDRVDGLVWREYPILSSDRYLEISAVYVDGKRPGDGIGVVGDASVRGGSAWSLITDSGWNNNRIRLRWEYAISEYDFDGDGGFDSEKESAISLLFTYRPWDQIVIDGQPMDLAFSVEHRRVGPFFATPAVQSQATDRDMLRAFINFSWAALRVDAGLSQESTNVDGNSLLPTDQTDIASVAINYSPLPVTETELPYGILGQQSYRFSLTSQKEETQELPLGYIDSGVDSNTDTLGIGADFMHERWNWGLAYDLIRFEDVTSLTPDSRDSNTRMNAAFNLSDSLVVTSRVQYSRLIYQDMDLVSRTRILGISLTYNPSQRWQTHFDVDVNRNEVSDDSSDTDTKQFAAGITWTAIPVKSNRPGVELMLDGNMIETTDHVYPDLSVDDYQLFFRVNVGWSALY